jgi:asparagine synthase (glutamine-hydrolysing)
MCGIAGAVATDEEIEGGLVARMCDLLDHRGPDSRGSFEEPGVALGVARLAVIDLEHGDQPIANEDGSVMVVCNGEIYNYRELRAELVSRGHRFSTESDTEVIVHLYEELGERCVESLRGMFAFALWDRRTRSLMLARDRVGKKPLLYAEAGGRLWFASELRAILASEDVPRELDHGAIDLYLHYQVIPSPRSVFAAIRKLRPAHTLTWRDGRISIRRYWKLSYGDRLAGLSDEEACERIRAALLEATRLRLRSDVPVGALLSGGVDSSSVVAAIARQSAGPVKTFSIGFDVPRFDESANAREVAEWYGTDHHELVLDANTLMLLPELAWHYGEPYADSSALASFALAELAGRHVTVVLNGDGGDESFGGYARHARPLPEEPLIRVYGDRRAHRYFEPQLRPDFYEPEFLHGLGASHDWRAVVERPHDASDAPDPVERILDVDVQTYLAEDLLVKMDIATMAHSLEARSPFCDQRLMELAAGLPMGRKVVGTRTKALLKRAVTDWLPASIVERPKMGFSIPLGDWLRGGIAADVLLDEAALGRGIFRRDQLRTLVAEHEQGIGEHGHRVWTLLMLELWFATYVDRDAAAGPVALSVG